MDSQPYAPTGSSGSSFPPPSGVFAAGELLRLPGRRLQERLRPSSCFGSTPPAGVYEAQNVHPFSVMFLSSKLKKTIFFPIHLFRRSSLRWWISLKIFCFFFLTFSFKMKTFFYCVVILTLIDLYQLCLWEKYGYFFHRIAFYCSMKSRLVDYPTWNCGILGLNPCLGPFLDHKVQWP